MAYTVAGAKLYYGASANPNSTFLEVVNISLPVKTYPKIQSKKQSRANEIYTPSTVPDFGECKVTCELTDDVQVENMKSYAGGTDKYWVYSVPGFGTISFTGWVSQVEESYDDVNSIMTFTVTIVATSDNVSDGS